MAGPVHSTNPPRLVHLIWGGHTVGIAVYEFAWKKKLNYRRGYCASYFRSLPIDRALSIFYAMKCPDQWRRPTRSIVRLTKIRNYSARKGVALSLLRRKMAARLFESFDNVHLSVISSLPVIFSRPALPRNFSLVSRFPRRIDAFDR